MRLSLLLLLACGPDPEVEEALPEGLEIRLRWVQGHPDETWEHARAGVWWGLSNLGAVPPPDEAGLSVVDARDDVVLFDLDLSRGGFSDRAEGVLLEALQPLHDSEEMRQLGYVDLGRFVMHVVFQPWVYSAVTGVCPDLETFRSRRQDTSPLTYGVTESLLVEGDRLIELNDLPGSLGQVGFSAVEGAGVLTGAEPVEVEVVDVMPNGRQRFAVYSAEGVLLPWADPTVSPAGQPGRCMWCHEGLLMTGTPDNPQTKPHLGYDDFVAQVQHVQGMMDAQRAAVPTSVDFSRYDVHTWFEWLAEMFLQPSTARLAREWGVDEADVERLLDERGLVTAANEEWPEVGPVWQRTDLDADATLARDAGVVEGSLSPLMTLSSAREPGDEALLFGEDLVDSLSDCVP